MYRLITFLFLALQCLTVSAGAYSKYQNAATTAYIKKYYKIAIMNMKNYKIPASITLAQGILESAAGTSKLATKANNHFGIKCKKGYTGPRYYKNDDKRNEPFKKYSSAAESYADHAMFLSSRKVYASLFKYDSTDYKSWAYGLKRCGYATNPKYPQELIGVIKANNLFLFDQNPDKYLAESVDEVVEETLPANNPPKMENGAVSGVKCVVVSNGKSYYSLAKEAGISVEDMYAFNDITADHILHEGDVLYVAAKNEKYMPSQFHYVEPQETLWSISQKYAISLSKLMSLNRLTESSVLQVGQRIFLHK